MLRKILEKLKNMLTSDWPKSYENDYNDVGKPYDDNWTNSWYDAWREGLRDEG